jgi:mannose-6-phosphate isomerase-like protein (cupin superfamily)
MDALPRLTRALSDTIRTCQVPIALLAAVDYLDRTLRAAEVREHFTPAPAREPAATLDAAISASAAFATAAAAQALREARSHLRWGYSYETRVGEETLAQRISFAELIGPDGPMSEPDARVGFTLLAPDTLYPLHAHPATELYWVMAGHAEWSRDSATEVVPPGRFVLHRSDEPHAMRTSAEPLLALWCWSGDLDTPARYV